jgi:hypothetical protein
MRNRKEIEDLLHSIYRYQDEDGSVVSHWRRLAVAVAHPMTTFAALRYLMSFPLVRVKLPSTELPSTRRRFRIRRPWHHYGFISSLIEIPSPSRLYWQGTSKQNLRTRSRHARDAGFTARVVSASDIDGVISQVLKDRGWEDHEVEADLRDKDLRRNRESLLGVAVFDSSEHAVAFCVGTKSGEVVRTLWAYTSQKGAVRWLCFSGYVDQVSAVGGRFIVEDAPWSFVGGNEIFAGHLGFVPARIRCT